MKTILKFLAAAIFILIGLAVLLIFRPQLLINDGNIKKLNIKGMKWEALHLEIKSLSFFEKHLDLELKNLCLDLPSVEIKGCIEELKIGATLEFKDGKIHLLDAAPFIVQSSQFLVNLKPTPPSPPSKPGLFSEIINKKTNISGIDVGLKAFRFVSGKTDLKGHLEVGGGEKLTGNLLLEDLASKTYVAGDFQLAQVHALVAHLKGKIGTDIALNATIDYKFQNPVEGDYKINLDFHEGNDLKIAGDFTGKMVTDKTTGILNATMSVADFKIPMGEKGNCKYEVGFGGKIDLDCPFEVIPQTALVSGVNLDKDFSQIHYVTQIHMKSDGEFDERGPWNGTAALQIKTDGAPSVQINGAMKSQFNKSPLSIEVLKSLKATASTRILISQFGKLVERLRTTPYAIPAPLNVLDGVVQCDLKGDFALSDLTVPFECKTDLNSSSKQAGQTLKLNTQGKFGMTPDKGKYKPSLELKVAVVDMQMALPRFGLKGPPPVFPDSRFKKTLSPSKASTNTPLKYIVTVKTTSPIRLLSNLAKSTIPVDVDLTLDSEKPQSTVSGMVRIKEFPAQLFRRDARIKYFDLKLASKDEESIHGLVEVHYTDYLIKIFVEGTTQEPVVRFDSSPPLAQEDIISALLFGRISSEVSPDQTGSVANTQAALADKAIGLSSMYLLASTPIESIGYNSQSQTFTAKFRLAEGTSLNVGAGEAGVKEVGVNRHLGGPWYIYTYLRNPTEREDRSTAAFLEWVLRY